MGGWNRSIHEYAIISIYKRIENAHKKRRAKTKRRQKSVHSQVNGFDILEAHCFGILIVAYLLLCFHFSSSFVSMNRFFYASLYVWHLFFVACIDRDGLDRFVFFFRFSPNVLANDTFFFHSFVSS